MSIRVAINGFGRVGRYVTRVLAKETRDIELVAVNSRADSATLAHLLTYDSVHKTFDLPVEYEENALIVGGKRVIISRVTSNLSELPWSDLGVEIVLETSGAYRDMKACQKHIEAGVRKVILSAPGKGLDATFVMGVNHETYDPAKHHVVSNASCTTNCLAPIVSVLHKAVGINHGLMNTIHAYTMDQRLLDGSHKDLRRARAAAMSMVPTTSGAARTVGEVIPALKGKLDGLAIRVPTPNVSILDFSAELSRNSSADEINEVLREAGRKGLEGILFMSDLPLVSVDFTSSPYSAIVDSALTNVIQGRFLKVLAWYDNESGFSHRMVDLACYMGSKL
jgi:glyceraldehyde 3-phosphate dehydrogenase